MVGKYQYSHMDDDLNQLHWLPIKKVTFKIALLVYKSLNGLAPSFPQEFLNYTSHGTDIRLNIPSTGTKYGSRAFSLLVSLDQGFPILSQELSRTLLKYQHLTI